MKSNSIQSRDYVKINGAEFAAPAPVCALVQELRASRSELWAVLREINDWIDKSGGREMPSPSALYSAGDPCDGETFRDAIKAALETVR